MTKLMGKTSGSGIKHPSDDWLGTAGKLASESAYSRMRGAIDSNVTEMFAEMHGARLRKRSLCRLAAGMDGKRTFLTFGEGTNQQAASLAG